MESGYSAIISCPVSDQKCKSEESRLAVPYVVVRGGCTSLVR